MLNVLARAMILAGGATLWLGGCREAAPTGQVAAAVDGEEITLGELRAEAAARDSQAGDTSPELLAAVLDRKLWAREAKRARLDQDIQFILARRRSEEAMLADLQIDALSKAVATPSDEDVDRFLQRYPAAFVSRTTFSIDQITVRPGGDATLAERMGKAKSLREVDTILSSEGVVGQRSRTEWNSMFMPASLADRLGKLPPDQLILQRDGDRLIAANVLAKTSVPLSYADRKALARQSLTRQRVGAAIASRLAELRASANIRLQPGLTLADPR